MAFRFLTILTFVVLISLAGVALEKKNLELRREITRQRYGEEILREKNATARLRVWETTRPVLTDPESNGSPN